MVGICPKFRRFFWAMGVLTGYAAGKDTDSIIKLFLEGAKDILSAAIVVGLAGGIIQILQGRAYYRSYITCLGFSDERGRKSGFGWCDVCNSDADQYHYPFGIGQSCFDDADYGSLLGCHSVFPGKLQ